MKDEGTGASSRVGAPPYDAATARGGAAPQRVEAAPERVESTPQRVEAASRRRDKVSDDELIG